MSIMKKLVFMLFCFTSLFATQQKRVELLALEVKQLTKEYESCKEKLLSCRIQDTQMDDSFLKECEQKNLLFKQKIKNLQKKLQTLTKENENLKIQINKQKKFEKDLQKKLVELQKKQSNFQKKEPKKQYKSNTKQKCQNIVETVIIEKSPIKQHLKLTKDGLIKIVDSKKIQFTKPKTFQTVNSANIYNAKNGTVVQSWEKGRSFTSYIESGEWIKITGYFVNKKWQKAKKELWIQKSDAVLKH